MNTRKSLDKMEKSQVGCSYNSVLMNNFRLFGQFFFIYWKYYDCKYTVKPSKTFVFKEIVGDVDGTVALWQYAGACE